VGAAVADVAAVEEPALVELAADVVDGGAGFFSSLLSQAGTKVPSAMAAATLTIAIVGFFIRAPNLRLLHVVGELPSQYG
jgi:hypothetical protein